MIQIDNVNYVNFVMKIVIKNVEKNMKQKKINFQKKNMKFFLILNFLIIVEL